jgi:tRNA-intron endonuclease
LEKVKALLVDKNLVIRNIEDARRLYAQGFYGKPIGIDKPKNANFNSPLVLNSLEGVYLAEKGLIEVYDFDEKRLNVEELKKKLLQSERMRLLYNVYKNLRDSGWIVRPGMKFGADFAIYRYGPGIDHAPFVITVVKKGVRIDPIEIIRAGRLSHSVRKTFILALEDSPGKIYYLMFKWFKL